MTSSMKNTFFKFRCQFDDFLAILWGPGSKKSYLQLIFFPTMPQKSIVWNSIRAIAFSKSLFFGANLHYIAHSNTYGH